MGVLAVPSQTVYEFQSPGVQTASDSSTSYFVPGNVVSICDSAAFSRAIEDEKMDSDSDGLGCARGLRSAFLFEAGLIVLVYAIWHLWHLAR